MLFADINLMWYALPLIVVISLVYCATRHEDNGAIFAHALRWMATLAGCMAVVFFILLAIGNWL